MLQRVVMYSRSNTKPHRICFTLAIQLQQVQQSIEKKVPMSFVYQLKGKLEDKADKSSDEKLYKTQCQHLLLDKKEIKNSREMWNIKNHQISIKDYPQN